MERARNEPMSKDLKTEVVLGASVVRVQEFMSRLKVLGLLELFWLERLVFQNCSALWIMCSGKMVCQDETSQVTYVTMVPRMGNETLRPLGVATGNALSVTRSEDAYVKTPPVGRRQPMTSLPACHNISAAGRLHHQLLRLKLASEAWPKA